MSDQVTKRARPARDLSGIVPEMLGYTEFEDGPSEPRRTVPVHFWLVTIMSLAFATWVLYLLVIVQGDRVALGVQSAWLQDIHHFQEQVLAADEGQPEAFDQRRDRFRSTLMSVRAVLPDTASAVDEAVSLLDGMPPRGHMGFRTAAFAVNAELHDVIPLIRDKNQAITVRLGQYWSWLSLMMAAALGMLVATTWLVLIAHRRQEELEWANGKLSIEVVERRRTQEQEREHSEELRRSNTDLEQFARVASHDLQEPLRGIAGFSELLQTQYSGALDQQADRYLEFIVSGARSMRSLLDDLFEYSRVGSASRTSTVSLTDAAGTAVQNLEVMIHELRARVEIEPLPEVQGNPIQVTRLFQILIHNALKFHGDATPIVRVSGRSDDGQCVISVTDNGIGISGQDTERIFDMFSRIHHNDRSDGNGVGLALARRIAECHGGDVSVHSEVGIGSTFTVTLSTNA